MHSFLTVVTDIGDSACLLALVGAVSVYLLARRSGRAAMFLVTSFLLAMLFIGLLKLAFLSCRNHFHYAGIHSPSGHAALSAATLWACAVLMRSQLDEHRRRLPLLLLTLLVAAIAASRVWLEFHSFAEVISGVATGLLSMMIARFLLLRNHGPGHFDAYALALWGVVAVIATHGSHLQGEELIHKVAFHIRGYVPFCNATG